MLPVGAPDPDVVNFLEEALAEARAGAITGVLLVKQDRERGIGYVIAGCKDRLTMLGFLSHAAYKLQDDD
jgi:hypothetical protein